MAVGFPTKSNWSAGDVLTASGMDDLAGTVNLLQNSNYPIAAGKNALINGGFDIWQRGTSSTTSSAGYQTADRWYCYGSAGITWAQESTTVPTGARYSFKISTTTTQQPVMTQVIETANAIGYAGKTVTFSIQAQASTSTGMTLEVNYSTGVDTAASGSFTAITASSGGSGTAASGSFTAISGVYAIPSTAKTIQVRIYPSANIVNGTSIYVGTTQLELGSVATTFSRAGGTIQGELGSCQRYYYTPTGGIGLVANYYFTTNVYAYINLPVSMRATPTITVTTGTGATVFSNGVSRAATAMASDTPTISGVGLAITTSAATAGNVATAVINNGAVSWSAEL